ncbi:uncharacterized protein LOC110452462 [Mizuhopecten yessoensis]|uniref:uncharacterized protein LOC110452462 n=1 Tax=Mizuhopecten yessoensis TaxID=6573 RepID=UPI000B45F334|nr:uncharacterized protein LOC110452462 [Mizuhopecten yessoensis]
MAINKKKIFFLTSFFLIYINHGAVQATTPPTDVSCPAPGTINVNVSDGTINSVLVECEYKGNHTVRTIPKNGTIGSILVTNCTINKSVKLVLFKDNHALSLGAVIIGEKSHIVKEIIVVCNGSHMTVNQNFTNSVLAPKAHWS